MKFVLAGGSGHIGTLLARAFHARGDEVLVLSREPRPSPWRAVKWDATTIGGWVEELESADAVINLTGRSVNCRYTPKNRHEIMESRLRPTRLLGNAIAVCTCAPRTWLQSSTATIYAHRYDAANDEFTGRIGGSEPGAPETWRFSIDVATSWERVFNDAVVPGTRKVALRSAIVMAPDRDGPFDLLLRLVRYRLGGTAGDGRQYVSWVHHEDFVRAVSWLVDHVEIDGVVNIAAPHPLPNADFMRELRKACGVSVGLPASTWMLELGAILMRTETELVLKSRRVVPTRLLREGFSFHWPTWPEAARDLCDAWRGGV